MQKEDGHKDDSRTSRGGTVKKEASTHTTNTVTPAIADWSEGFPSVFSVFSFFIFPFFEFFLFLNIFENFC